MDFKSGEETFPWLKSQGEAVVETSKVDIPKLPEVQGRLKPRKEKEGSSGKVDTVVEAGKEERPKVRVRPEPVKVKTTEKKVPLKPVHVPEETNKKAVAAKKLSLDRQPQTREEARSWSFEHYEEARRLYSRKMGEEALKHAQKGIALWENAALYVVKARCMNDVGLSMAAKTAAERAVGRGDYWRPESRESALREKLRALEAIYAKSPSSIVERELDEVRKRLH